MENTVPYLETTLKVEDLTFKGKLDMLEKIGKVTDIYIQYFPMAKFFKVSSGNVYAESPHLETAINNFLKAYHVAVEPILGVQKAGMN